MSVHKISQLEVSADNREEAARFFEQVFGWKIQNIPEMDYSMADTGQDFRVGINPIKDGYPAGTVTFYIDSDAIEATLAEIEKHGGKTILGKSEVPGFGWFAFFADPTGNMLGLWKNMPQS